MFSEVKDLSACAQGDARRIFNPGVSDKAKCEAGGVLLLSTLVPSVVPAGALLRRKLFSSRSSHLQVRPGLAGARRVSGRMKEGENGE